MEGANPQEYARTQLRMDLHSAVAAVAAHENRAKLRAADATEDRGEREPQFARQGGRPLLGGVSRIRRFDLTVTAVRERASRS